MDGVSAGLVEMMARLFNPELATALDRQIPLRQEIRSEEGRAEAAALRESPSPTP
ncbi:MAG: hypothetical protein OXG34_11310 [bacterium]|nr:hypothetical protein [bacterium]MCY3962232.1 hypothetical protein [bacterium]MCY4135815.1 hypothetical protein [bacterium]